MKQIKYYDRVYMFRVRKVSKQKNTGRFAPEKWQDEEKSEEKLGEKEKLEWEIWKELIKIRSV